MGNLESAEHKKHKVKKKVKKRDKNDEKTNSYNNNLNKPTRKISDPISTIKDNNNQNNTNDNKSKEHTYDRKIREISLNIVGGSLAKDIRECYKFKNLLGGGQFGSVRVAYKRGCPDKLYAVKSIKTINIAKGDMEGLMREVEIISSLKHPNIVRFYETYHDEQYFHIVMELCTGNEVFEQIVHYGKISELTVSKIIFKVLHAIAYCHSKGITHRDIKPENILLEHNGPEAEVKLIDFGLSRKYSYDQKMHTILGTPFYIAPEVLKGEYDEKCDVWSIGAITYIMLSGSPPFNGKSDIDIFDEIIQNPLVFPQKNWEKISNDAISFITHCMEKEPIKRYSAIEALKDPWFKYMLDNQHKEKYLNPNILNNLKNFSKPEKFKNLVLNFLVNNVSQKELVNLKNAFNAIDLNHSGHINANELEKAFDHVGTKVSGQELNTIINEAGEKTIGKIEYNEFLIACMDQKKNMRKEKLEAAFKYFDIDNSGYIDSTDIKNALLRSGQKIVNEEAITSIVEEVCHDNKGKISFEIFLKMFEFEN